MDRNDNEPVEIGTAEAEVDDVSIWTFGIVKGETMTSSSTEKNSPSYVSNTEECLI